jgi:cytochrome P450
MHPELQAAAGALFDLEPETVRCPYPLFAQLSEHAPVMWSDELEAFVVTQYDLIVDVLRHPEAFSSRNTTGPKTDRQLKALMADLISDDAEIRSMIERRALYGTSRVLVRADPPVHTRQRAIVSRAFSPSVVRSLEPAILQLTEELIDAFDVGGLVEIGAQLASPLPMTVIATALGVELERMADFKRWSDGLVAGVGRNDMGPEELAQIMQSRSDLEDYLLQVMSLRQTSPTDDLISRIIHAEVDGERLRIHEALDMIVQFLVAGNETTAKLITATILRLAQNPALAAELRAQPDQIPALLEEVLRLEPPSTGLYRMAVADCELGGLEIPAGSALWLVYAAGNRDARMFDAPDECVIDRKMPAQHLGFGLGAHFCIGAGLARAESRIAIEAMLRRFDRIELAVDPDQIEYESSYMVHGMRALPLVLSPAT